DIGGFIRYDYPNVDTSLSSYTEGVNITFIPYKTRTVHINRFCCIHNPFHITKLYLMPIIARRTECDFQWNISALICVIREILVSIFELFTVGLRIPIMYET